MIFIIRMSVGVLNRKILTIVNIFVLLVRRTTRTQLLFQMLADESFLVIVNNSGSKNLLQPMMCTNSQSIKS